jgi:hypothetical protein
VIPQVTSVLPDRRSPSVAVSNERRWLWHASSWADGTDLQRSRTEAAATSSDRRACHGKKDLSLGTRIWFRALPSRAGFQAQRQKPCSARAAPLQTYRSTANCLADRPMRPARPGCTSRRFIASAKVGWSSTRRAHPGTASVPSAPSVVETGAAVQLQRHRPRCGRRKVQLQRHHPRRKVRPQGIPIPAKAKAMTPCVDPKSRRSNSSERR